MTTSPSELHKFIFDGLPVRGMLVRLTDAWQQVLTRRAGAEAGSYPAPVQNLLGQMAAAATLMQANIKFEGALVLQVFGDGPVKLAVAEVQPDLSLRTTAKVVGPVPEAANLEALMNEHGQGRCAITLDPLDRLPGQQPYQGVVPLQPAEGASFTALAEVLEHYMRQSEQLDTRLVLAANDQVAAGLLIQRLPAEGGHAKTGEDIDPEEDFRRIAHLAATLTADELLNLTPETVMHRLFWEEPLRRFEPLQPRFACRCSRAKVAGMLRGLGEAEVQDILAQEGQARVHCDFCGAAYAFDAVDAAGLFASPLSPDPGGAPSGSVH